MSDVMSKYQVNIELKNYRILLKNGTLLLTEDGTRGLLIPQN